MNEAYETKSLSLDTVQALDELLKSAHEKYYKTNEELKKYSGRLLKGDELKQAEEAAIRMEMIFRYEIEPIGNFISLRSAEILKMAHHHQEWRDANIKINEKPSILDPNLVH